MKYLILLLLCTNAFADLEATRPKFKVGDKVRADKNAEWISGCNTDADWDLYEKSGRPLDKIPMCTRRGKQPWAGMKTTIIEVAERTCARDVGSPRLSGIDSCDEWRYKVDFGPVGRGVWTIHESSLKLVGHHKKRKK